MSIQECEKMYTTKYDVSHYCKQYKNLFLNLNDIKRTDKILKQNQKFYLLSIGQFHNKVWIYATLYKINF